MKPQDCENESARPEMSDATIESKSSELPDRFDLDYNYCNECGRTFRGSTHNCKGKSKN